MPTIPFKWPQTLGKKDPWRNLRVNQLVRQVVAEFGNLENHHDEFFTVTPPTDTLRLKQLAQHYVDVLKKLDRLLIHLHTTGKPYEPSNLHHFFPLSIVPKDECPQDLATAIHLSLFRGIYRTLRQIIVEFTSARRREGWEVMDPMGLAVDQPMPSKLLGRTFDFNDIYAETFNGAVFTLYLLLRARSLKRRVGDDGVLLDSFALGLLSTTPFLRGAFLNAEIPSSGQDNPGTHMFRLYLITMEANREWEAHSNRLRSAGRFPPQDLLKSQMSRILPIARPRPRRKASLAIS